MSALRFKAVEEAFKKKALCVTPPSKFTTDYYGKYVFTKSVMAKYLSKDIMKSLNNAIEKELHLIVILPMTLQQA